MTKVHHQDIKEIANAIANDNTCYVHRQTAKVTIIDHSIADAKLLAAQEQTLASIENKIEKHLKIEPLKPKESRLIMVEFLDELPDKSVRKQLSNALNRKNPVRNFMQTIESDMELNQHWRNFNAKEYHRWVSNILIEAYLLRR